MQFCAAQILSMTPSDGGAAAAAASVDHRCAAITDMAIALLQCLPPMVELSEQVRDASKVQHVAFNVIPFAHNLLRSRLLVEAWPNCFRSKCALSRSLALQCFIHMRH